MNLNVFVPADDPFVLVVLHKLTVPNQEFTKILSTRSLYSTNLL